APVVPHARQIATILESVKSSPIWNMFEIYNLQQPVCDALDLEYFQFMDNIGDGIAILCLLNAEVNSINNIILQQLEDNAIDLYSVNSLVDDKTLKDYDIEENYTIRRNMIIAKLLNSFNASGITKHCLTLKH
ncbi:5672_t:CDS:2, partial [Cetraspora pellucida]